MLSRCLNTVSISTLQTDRGDDAEHDREDAAYDGLGDGDEERPHLGALHTVQYSSVQYSTVQESAPTLVQTPTPSSSTAAYWITLLLPT